MVSHDVSVTNVSRHFSEFVNRVTYKGEHFLLHRGREIVAELRPATKGRRLGDLPALMKGLPRLSTDEIKSFAEDLRKSKKTLAKRKIGNPWES